MKEDAPKSAGFYLSQVTLPEAWTQLKTTFSTIASVVVVFAVIWVLSELGSGFIPQEISNTTSSIPSWVWYAVMGVALWAMMGGDKITFTVPKFSIKRLLLVSICAGGFFLLDFIPKWIGIPIFIVIWFITSFIYTLVEFGRRKYEEGIAPSE